MDLSSDSDDDLLPNLNTFNALFTKVQQQTREAAPTSSSTKSSKKAKLSKKTDRTEKGLAKSSGSKSKTTTSSKPKKKDVEISDDTKNLLAEVDKLTNPISSKIPSAKSAPSKEDELESSKASSTSRSRPKRNERKVNEDVIQLSDDDSLEILDTTFDSFCENNVMPVEPVEEFCSLRIRWKQEVLRFKVPKEAKMSTVRMDLAERVSTRADNLVILDEANSEEVSDNTSVDSIPFGTTLEAFEREIVNNNSNLKVKNLDPNFILIKLQGCGGYRERCQVAMKRTTHVKQLIEDYIEKFGLHGKQFKLVFDGDDVDLTETPESLDLENNDMLDVVEI